MSSNSMWLLLAMALYLSVGMMYFSMVKLSRQDSSADFPGPESIEANRPSSFGMGVLETVFEDLDEGLSTPKVLGDISVPNKREARRLSPPNAAASEGIQVSEDTMILVGGYTNSFTNVSRTIQFFNISSQQWLEMATLTLPQYSAETHQGKVFDEKSRTLYIVSGQKGPGCQPATTAAVRLHLDTGRFEPLPDLPLARYAPGITIVTNPMDTAEKHLHVFGGASKNRNDSATDHWRLRINERSTKILESSAWDELEPLPDGGTHGTSYVSDEGFIVYTGFCNLDPGVIGSSSMADCHQYAVEQSNQLLHHVSNTGLVYRYPTAFAKSRKTKVHWERMADMPYPACHAGSLYYNGRIHIIGGGLATPQILRGSAPASLSVIQSFDPIQNDWQIVTFPLPKRTHLFLLSVWIDRGREKIFGLHSGNSLLEIALVEKASNRSAQDHNMRSRVEIFRNSYLQKTRGLAIGTFCSCIKSAFENIPKQYWNMSIHTLFDDDFDIVRGTWNKRYSHLQYPDIVARPTQSRDVSIIVTCAKRTGHHVCGRNGRHSYDGTTCTRGIVIDVSGMKAAECIHHEDGVVRLGAGFTLGQAATWLEGHGLALPAGTCPSVGLTGLTLNGGQGPLSRLFGMTSDFLSAVELVDNHGQIVTATPTNEYSDLLWYARGGGAAGYHYPGIITGLQYSTLPKIHRNDTLWTRVRIRFRPTTVHKAVVLLSGWQAFFLGQECTEDPLCRRITAEPWLFMEYRKRKKTFEPALSLVVYFFGNEGLHQEFMAKYLPKLAGLAGGGNIKTVERFDHLDFHRKLGGLTLKDDLLNASMGHDLNAIWHGKSAVAESPVSSKAFESIVQSIFLSKPLYRRYAEFKPLGGKISEKQSDHGAFWHRDAKWWVLINHFFDSRQMAEDQERLINQQHERIVEEMGDSFGGCYAGYVHHGNSTSRDLSNFYGKHSDQIRAIKRARDPHNLFSNFMPNRIQDAQNIAHPHGNIAV